MSGSFLMVAQFAARGVCLIVLLMSRWPGCEATTVEGGSAELPGARRLMVPPLPSPRCTPLVPRLNHVLCF